MCVSCCFAYLLDEKNLNCEIYNLTTPYASGTMPTRQKERSFQKSSSLLLYSNTWEKTIGLLIMFMKPSIKFKKFMAPKSVIQYLTFCPI